MIIPEGVETLYSASETGHSHNARSHAHVTRVAELEAIWPGSLKHDTWRRGVTALPIDVGVTTEADTGLDSTVDISQETQDVEHDEVIPPGEPGNADGQGEAEEDFHDPHAWVGVSLITGFILMYLIDTLPRHAGKASQPQRSYISMGQFSLNRSSRSAETGDAATHSSTSRPSSTTVGLVIHACADGIALGASSTTTSRLTFIIFIALMVHKAPAAFGLTSVLLKQGLSKRAARAHLIVFSLAAPFGALLTWAAAHILGYSSSMLGSNGSTDFATGVLLLFSGGTFLYVAMHTMQESGQDHDHDAQTNGYASVPMTDMYESGGPAQPGRKQGSFADTLVCVAGMLIPLLTQIGGHGH